MSLLIKSNSMEITRVARIVSNVFHPFTVALGTLVLVIYLDGAPLVTALKWTSIGFGIVILPLTIYLVLNVRSGQYSDWSISIREQRHKIYLLAAVCFMVLVVIFIMTDAPPIAIACLYAALPTIFIAALINRFVTKISLHAIAMAGCTAALFWVSWRWGIALGSAALLVAWSRVHLRQHTLLQVVIGSMAAAGSVMIVFTYYL